VPISGVQGLSASPAAPASGLRNLAIYDPRDTNQDGIVSPAEDFAYSLKHPELEALKRLKTNFGQSTAAKANTSPLSLYSQKGALKTSDTKVSNALDLYA
jgi:hypothetical protein